jgi:hypothetical protein
VQGSEASACTASEPRGYFIEPCKAAHNAGQAARDPITWIGVLARKDVF